jgi:hypothetical protein
MNYYVERSPRPRHFLNRWRFIMALLPCRVGTELLHGMSAARDRRRKPERRDRDERVLTVMTQSFP